MSAAKPSPNWVLRLAVVAVVLAGIAFGAIYMLREVAPVMAVYRGTAVRIVPGTVEVKAESMDPLKSEVAGRVSSTGLDIGKRVFKNDVLLQIDTGDVDLEIERIKNDIIAAKRRVEVGSVLRAEELNAKDTLDNDEKRMKAGGYAAADFEKQKRLYQQLVQRRELDEVNLRQSLDTLQNQLLVKEREKSKMTITAPSDGVITFVDARVGSVIDRNALIATIISVGRTVEAKLSEENFAVVKLGQKVTVRFLTYGNEQYNGVVSKILPSADATTQRYTVYLDIFLPEGRVLLPGLTGEVSIIIAERANALIIPPRALIGDNVYVVRDGRVELRKVEKGYESLNEVEILKGLAEGDLVIVEQQDRFRSGDRVRTRVIERN